MTITPRPEQQQMIQEAIQAGLIKSAEEALDVGLGNLRDQLRTSTRKDRQAPSSPRTLVDVFEPAGDLADDLNLSRKRLESTLREMAQFSHKIPSLPDESFTRESLYRDHD